MNHLLGGEDIAFLLDTLPDPQAICDPRGLLLYANPAAWSLLREALSLESGTPLRLNLSVRATLSHVSLRQPGLAPSSVFMANVQLHRADLPEEHPPLGLLNVTLTALPNQKLAVRLAPQVAPPARAADSTERRLLLELDAFLSRAPLLGSPIERITLLVNALQAITPDLAFVVELGLDPDSTSRRLIFPWPDVRALLRELPALDAHPQDDLAPDQLLLPGARSGLRLLLQRGGRTFGILQAESRAAEPLSPALRAALRLAVHLLNQTLAQDAHLAAPPTLDQLQALVCICDPARRVLSANARFRELTCTQHTPPAILAHSDLLDLVHPEDREDLRRAAARTMGERAPQHLRLRLLGHSPDLPWSAYLAFVGADGHVAGFSLILHAPEATEPAQPLRPTEPSALLSADDLPALQGHDAERFAALGRLAAGIAHEIKNPLTSILSYSDYLLGKYRDRLFESRDSERLERIIQSVDRIDRIVRDLLVYARPEDHPRTPARLHDLLREAVALCEIQLRPVHVELHLDAPNDHILAVAPQVHQIFINLLCNAAEAIPPRRRGELRLTTHAEPDAILVTLQDNGRGIAPQHLAHIFDPFFTRRPDNTGTGLGLSIVRKLAAHHDARLDVQSTPDVGTTFTLRFPLADAATPLPE